MSHIVRFHQHSSGFTGFTSSRGNLLFTILKYNLQLIYFNILIFSPPHLFEKVFSYIADSDNSVLIGYMSQLITYKTVLWPEHCVRRCCIRTEDATLTEFI